MSGSKVLEGFGRLLVLAVGPNSQQGMIQSMVMHGSTAVAGEDADSSSSGGAAVPMLREATPLTSRLEDVANSIGGVGLAAALAVLAVNSVLYTAEVLAAGGSLWSSASLEVRRTRSGSREHTASSSVHACLVAAGCGASSSRWSWHALRWLDTHCCTSAYCSLISADVHRVSHPPSPYPLCLLHHCCCCCCRPLARRRTLRSSSPA
jgi:hypothetical protein